MIVHYDEDMGKDINGVVQREPWKAYDIDEVDALLAKKDKEIRRLKRALYKACAMWADRTRLICSVFGSDAPKIRWERMYDKCRAKAKEYK